MSKLIIENSRISAIATDDYVFIGTEQAVIDAPEGFSSADLHSYRYENGVLCIPAPPPVPLTKLEFLDRFTDSELLAVREASKTAPEVELWLWRFDRADGITLSDSRTVAGVQALEASGLIAKGRAAQILA